MIKLTKTPILPNCQVPNRFFWYNCKSYPSKIEKLTLSLSQFSLVTGLFEGTRENILHIILAKKQAKNVVKHNKKKRNRRNKARKAAAAKALAEVEAEKVMGGNTESSEIEKPQQTKGQLISKCPFGVIVWTKIPMKFFPRFLP